MLYLFRGLPGAGKTTAAIELQSMIPGSKHFENGMFRQEMVGYKYSHNTHVQARENCLNAVHKHLQEGQVTMVSNVFTSMHSIRPYLELKYPITIVDCTSDKDSVYQIPEHDLKRLKDRYVPIGNLVLNEELKLHNKRYGVTVCQINPKLPLTESSLYPLNSFISSITQQSQLQS